MRFPKQFLGGVLVGLAFGILIGAALVEGNAATPLALGLNA